jgi:hypothetical protein
MESQPQSVGEEREPCKADRGNKVRITRDQYDHVPFVPCQSIHQLHAESDVGFLFLVPLPCVVTLRAGDLLLFELRQNDVYSRVPKGGDVGLVPVDDVRIARREVSGISGEIVNGRELYALTEGFSHRL